MVLNIPKQHDEWLTIQFLLFFLIGFGINVYSNGQATLYYFETEYSIDNNIYFTDDKIQELKDTYQSLSYKNDWVNFFLIIMYFGISPLVNFYFGIFKFKKGQWKSLNNSTTSNFGGKC